MPVEQVTSNETLVKLLRAMANDEQYKEHKHDVILAASADRIELQMNMLRESCNLVRRMAAAIQSQKAIEDALDQIEDVILDLKRRPR